MAKTIANVLVGVAKLLVRQPNDAIAEWSTADYHEGTHSVKLTKRAGGINGGTGIKFCPPGINLGTWNTLVNRAPLYEVWYRNQKTTGVDIRNWIQWGFRFDDPGGNAHAEITVYPYHSMLGDDTWTACNLGNMAEEVDGAEPAPANCYGANEDGEVINTWAEADALTTKTIRAAIGNDCVVEDDTSADHWVLSWVKINLWEGGDARYSYIDEIKMHNVSYSLEPDGDLPALELESPCTEVGYTEDGVTMEYAAEQSDIVVHEETFPIGSALTAESLSVTCNMAEASLANLNNAMAGAVLLGSKITLGAGVNKTMNLQIVGTNPAGFLRAIHIPLAVAGGTVGMSYKKGEKTIVPVTFKALKGDEPACTIVDNAY